MQHLTLLVLSGMVARPDGASAGFKTRTARHPARVADGSWLAWAVVFH